MSEDATKFDTYVAVGTVVENVDDTYGRGYLTRNHETLLLSETTLEALYESMAKQEIYYKKESDRYRPSRWEKFEVEWKMVVRANRLLFGDLCGASPGEDPDDYDTFHTAMDEKDLQDAISKSNAMVALRTQQEEAKRARIQQEAQKKRDADAAQTERELAMLAALKNKYPNQ